jgi:N-acetylmuramoyl-L-alanine amidase
MGLTIQSSGMRAFLVCALGWGLIFWAGSAFGDPALMRSGFSGTVAIDPGHGGQDRGARGPTGLLEKTVVLELARQLALELEADYRVVLTRSGDYAVDPDQRAAIANHAKADLMISLHTGAGFQHTARGRAIYYYAGINGNSPAHKEKTPAGAQPFWDQVQIRHTSASQALADIMKAQLETTAVGVGCKIQGAPLVVLQGADMPAVLIELGHITHPDTEKALATPQGMALLVKAISQGVHRYMDQRNP